jgi:hypothetical protein
MVLLPLLITAVAALQPHACYESLLSKLKSLLISLEVTFSETMRLQLRC